jgi:hypothetical protein
MIDSVNIMIGTSENGGSGMTGQWKQFFTTMSGEIDHISELVGDSQAGLTHYIRLLDDAIEKVIHDIRTLSGTTGTGGKGHATGFHGYVDSGDYMVVDGQKRDLGEHGKEWMDIYPAHQSYGRGGGNESIANALNGLQVTLVVGDKKMDAYLQARERTMLNKERLRIS